MKFILASFYLLMSAAAWALPGLPSFVSLESEEYDRLYTRAFQSDCIKVSNSESSLTTLFSSAQQLDCSNNKSDVNFCSCLDEISDTNFSKEEAELMKTVQNKIREKLEEIEEEQLIKKYQDKMISCLEIVQTYGLGSCMAFELPEGSSERAQKRYKALGDMLDVFASKPNFNAQDTYFKKDNNFFNALIADLEIRSQGGLKSYDENTIREIKESYKKLKETDTFRESPIFNVFMNGSDNNSKNFVDEFLSLGDNSELTPENIRIIKNKLIVLQSNQENRIFVNTPKANSLMTTHAMSPISTNPINEYVLPNSISKLDDAAIEHLTLNSSSLNEIAIASSDKEIARSIVLQDVLSTFGTNITSNLSNEFQKFVDTKVPGELFKDLFLSEPTKENIEQLAKLRSEIFSELTDEEKKVLKMNNESSEVVFNFRFDQLYCDNRKEDHLFSTQSDIARQIVPLEEREQFVESIKQAKESSEKLLDEANKLENINDRIENLKTQKAILNSEAMAMQSNLNFLKEIYETAKKNNRFPEQIKIAKKQYERANAIYSQKMAKIKDIDKKLAEYQTLKRKQHDRVRHANDSARKGRNVLNHLKDRYADRLRESYKNVDRTLQHADLTATQATTNATNLEGEKFDKKIKKVLKTQPLAKKAQSKQPQNITGPSPAAMNPTVQDKVQTSQYYQPTRTDFNYINDLQSSIASDNELNDLESQVAELEKSLEKEKKNIKQKKEQDEMDGYLSKIDLLSNQINDAKKQNDLAKAELARVKNSTQLNSVIPASAPTQREVAGQQSVSSGSFSGSPQATNTAAPQTIASTGGGSQNIASPQAPATPSSNISSNRQQNVKTTRASKGSNVASPTPTGFGLSRLEQVTLTDDQNAIKLDEKFNELSPLEQKAELLKLFEQNNTEEIFVDLGNGHAVKVQKDSLDQLEQFANEEIRKQSLKELAIEELEKEIDSKTEVLNTLTARVRNLDKLMSEGTK